MNCELTPERIEEYRRNGFVVIENLLTLAELVTFVSRAKRLQHGAAPRRSRLQTPP